MSNRNADASTADQIAALSARIEQLEAERDHAAAAAEVGKFDKALAAVQSVRPVSVTADNKQAAEAYAASRCDEARAIVAMLPKVAKLLDQVLQLVADACPDLATRASMFVEIGRAFREPVAKANRGQSASVAVAIEQIAAPYRRVLDPPKPPRLQPPLIEDCPVYARHGFSYKDAGRPNISLRTITAGAICLVPAPVADAAVSRGLAERLEPPRGVRLRVVRSVQLPNGKRYATGFERIFAAEEAALLLAERAAEPVHQLLPSELAAYRVGRPELASVGAVELGMFNNDDDEPAPEAAAAA